MEKPKFLTELEEWQARSGKLVAVIAIIDGNLNKPSGVGGYKRVKDRNWAPQMGEVPVSFHFFESDDVKVMSMKASGLSKSIIIRGASAVISRKPSEWIRKHLWDETFRAYRGFADNPTIEEVDDFINTYRFAEHESLVRQD